MRRIPSIRVLMLIATITMFIPACGPEKTEFDPTATYTPDSLAQELIFQFRGLKPGAASSRKRSGKPRAIPVEPSKSEAATKDATKKALAATLDDLIEDTALKLRFIKGMLPPEASKQVAAIVAKDTTLSAKEKTEIVDKLEQLAANP